MSILICSTKHGGCGYIATSEDWLSALGHSQGLEGDDTPCPACGKIHCAAYVLTDKNFENLVDEDNREKARQMLDKDNASIHGNELAFCVKEGYIAEKNLTPEQREELVALQH